MAWDGDTRGGIPPPLPPQGGPYLMGILPKNTVTTPVSERGVYGVASNRTNLQVQFLHCHVEKKKCDNGGGKPTITQMPQIQHVCITLVSQQMEPLKRLFPMGIRAEVSPTGGRGGKGRIRNCNQCLRDPCLPCLFYKINWESPVGIG